MFDVERVCVTEVVNETDTVGVDVYDDECVEQPEEETVYVGETLLLAETVRVPTTVADTLDDFVTVGDADRDPEWVPDGERLAELEKDCVTDDDPLTVCDLVGDPDTEGDAELLRVILDDEDTQRVAVDESDAVVESVIVGDTECDVVSVGELESVGDTELLVHTVGDRERVGLAVIDDDSVDVTDCVDETDGLGLIVVDTRGVVDTSGDFEGVVDTDALVLSDAEREKVEVAEGDVERDGVTESEIVTDGLVVTVFDPTGDDEIGAERETVKEMEGDVLSELVAVTVGLALKHEEPENEAVIDELRDGEPDSVFVMLTLAVCDDDVDIVRVILGEGDSVPVLEINGENEFVTLVVYVDEADRHAVGDVVDVPETLAEDETDAQIVDVPETLLEPEFEKVTLTVMVSDGELDTVLEADVEREDETEPEPVAQCEGDALTEFVDELVKDPVNVALTVEHGQLDGDSVLVALTEGETETEGEIEFVTLTVAVVELVLDTDAHPDDVAEVDQVAGTLFVAPTVLVCEFDVVDD